MGLVWVSLSLTLITLLLVFFEVGIPVTDQAFLQLRRPFLTLCEARWVQVSAMSLALIPCDDIMEKFLDVGLVLLFNIIKLY